MSGQDPAEYAGRILRDVIAGTLRTGNQDCSSNRESWDEDLIDHDFIEECGRDKGIEVPSVEDVRQALAKLPGSLAEQIIADREDRL